MSASDIDLANAIRALAMDAVEAANSIHPGMPIGEVDAFTRYLKFDAATFGWKRHIGGKGMRFGVDRFGTSNRSTICVTNSV